MTRPTVWLPLRRAFGLASIGLAITAVAPAAASAHSLTGRYESPLPLEAYLAAAALAVALSFAIVLLRRPAASEARSAPDSHLDRSALARDRACAASGCSPGSGSWPRPSSARRTSDADVASLFLWTYGWVVLPLVCALDRAGVGPARSVHHAPRPRRGRAATLRRARLADRGVPGAAGRLAGGRRRSRSSCGSSSCSRSRAADARWR